ncbi:hypothetical protein EZV62_013499 [Acer yangbiense]|uniref:YqgF/RNase H-like domain-containing protein n=1 Tax=Acer yangbiense TaxID=1000413 RepID=A0A5C7I094_9ROSI|nr:hypothetical protein EZV62_013499 [Acer yangbiense]
MLVFFIHRKMKFLKPVTFYKEIFKDILMKNGSKHGRLLGLDVSDHNYVSLAVSDSKNLTAVPLSRGLHRQETNMADIFQSLISEHNLVCFVVGTPYTWDRRDAIPFLEQTQIFIDNLCKTGKLEGFKYTYWDTSIRSKNSEFVLEQHVKFMLEHLNQPQNMSKTIMDKCLAVSALQGFLDCTNKMVAEDIL